MPISELIKKDPDPYKQPRISLVHIVQGYNQALDEIYELERQGKIVVVPSVEEIEKILQEKIWTTLEEYGKLGNSVRNLSIKEASQSIIDFFTKQKD